MRPLDEPNMSDTTILVSVEDLISMAMGPPDGNTVDFKMIQTILHILARQMRLLEQKVVLEVGPLPDYTTTSQSTSSSAKGKGEKKARGRPATIKEEARGKRKDSDEGRREEKRSKSVDSGKARKKRSTDEESESDGKRRRSDDKKRSKSVDVGRDEARASRDVERGGKDEAKGGKRGKDVERGGKADKDVEKGAKGKDAERSGKADKDVEKGAKGKDLEKGGKGGKDEERPEKGGKVGKADKDAEKGAKSKDTEKSEKGGKGGIRDEEGKGGKFTEKGSKGEKRDKDDEKGGRYKETGSKGGKDKFRSDSEEGRPEKGSGKDKEKGGIGIKEVSGKGKDKLLVVEKASTTGARADRRGSIAVVTQSQFALVQAAVEELEKRSLPLPPPAMPGNEKLRSDLASGSATLTDAMQALQVAARVQAAEQAIGRLGGLLTSLAAAGALPDDVDDDEEDSGKTPRALDKRRASTTSRKSVMIQSSRGDMGRKQSVASGAAGGGTGGSVTGGGGGARASPSVVVPGGRPSVSAGRPSITSRGSPGQPLVTQADMSAAMAEMRQDLMKNMQAIVGRAQAAAEASAGVAKNIGEKLELAVRLNNRITSLNSLVGDYAEQLAGFDAGLTTQMMSFQEQMVQMRKDLATGLAQFDNANNNAETAAVMELTERYELLVTDLDRTLLAHQALTTFQQQLSADFRALYLCVEMLREQKADRDEVLDGLRDKADNERLAGLLREDDFNQARSELEMRLELCHEKFRKQDNMWVRAIKDLTQVVQTKAELMDLLKTREETTQQLQAIQDMIKKLALVLGEPKAAMLTRKLARDALCGSCLVPALMEPEDAARGAPPRLPPLPARGAPVGAEAVCDKPWKPPQPPDLRSHKCHRWVGGSHTLLGAGARATPEPPELPRAATRKFAGPGYDGRLYMMEVELEPCVECNPLEAAGGGDSQPLGTINHGVDIVGVEACSCAADPGKEELDEKEGVEPVEKVEEKGDGEQIPVEP